MPRASRSGVELKGFMEIGNLADSHKTGGKSAVLPESATSPNPLKRQVLASLPIIDKRKVLAVLPILSKPGQKFTPTTRTETNDKHADRVVARRGLSTP